jgi:predicted dehydrogenase
MAEPRPLSVLILGCGNIAGGFDAARPPESWPLSHAAAFRRHPGFRIVACVEPDAQKRQEFMRRWDVPRGYATAGEVPAELAIDVVSICSPTACHDEHLTFAIARGPRLVFCEKPLTPDAERSQQQVEACAAAGIPLAVNHTRRWAPDLRALADELRQGRFGAVRSLSGVYNKGVLNNGSHLIDLIHLLLGEGLRPIAVGPPVWDYGPDDPSVPALLVSPSGVPVTLQVAHAADYALFELQIVTAGGVLTMEDGGATLRLRTVIDSPTFAGYRCLGPAAIRAGQTLQAMARAVDNLYGALTSGQPLASTGSTALAAQRLCAALKSAALSADRKDPS